MNQISSPHPNNLVDHNREIIEFANRHFTLAKYLVRNEKDVFRGIEKMMLCIMAVSIVILLTIHLMPRWLAITIAILLIQRVAEFVIVYSRNFIYGRGRVFTDFKDPRRQGQWLIMMFSLNIFQLLVIFSIWYRLITLINPQAFFGNMTVLNCIYFSVTTFVTEGFGDFHPVSSLAKILVIMQNMLTYFTLVIVVNGLISIHFRK